MTQFFALLRLQFLARFADWKPQNLKRQWAEKRGKALLRVLGVAVLVIYLGFLIVFAENAVLSALVKIGIPDLLLSIAITVSMLSTLILSFFFVMSSLYFDRDALFLASLPVPSRTVLSAKLTQVYFSETAINAMFLLPACVLYGIHVRPDALFYGRMILVWLASPILPLAIVSFLSTLLIRLSALRKRRDLIVTVCSLALLAGYMILVMNASSVMGSDSQDFLLRFLSSNAERISAIAHFFPPAAWAAAGLLGSREQLLLFLALCALAAVLTLWALGALYRRLVLLQGSDQSTVRRKASGTAYTSGSSFRACCQREIRQILRVPAYATNILPMAFMPLFMVGTLLFTAGRGAEEGSESLSSILSKVNGGIIIGGMALLLAFMAGMNPALSSAVTREGKGHDALLSLPIAPRTHIWAKLSVGMGLSILGCLPAAVVLGIVVPGHMLHALIAFLAAILYAYTAGCLSLANDTRHPKFDWLTETEAVKQKSGTLIGLLIGWAFLAVLVILSYLALSHGASAPVYAAALLLLLSLCAWGAHMALVRAADTHYRQQ